MQSACHKQKTALFQIVHVCTCIKYSRSAAELIYASAQLTFSIVWSLQGESIPDERSLAEEAAVPDISEADTSTVSTMNSATSSGARIMAATLLEDAKLEQSAKRAFETPSLSRQPAKQANEDTSFDQENPSESQKQECRPWLGGCLPGQGMGCCLGNPSGWRTCHRGLLVGPCSMLWLLLCMYVGSVEMRIDYG